MNIVEKVERVAGRISARVEYFVTHLGGDADWEGRDAFKQAKSFNPRQMTTEFLHSPSGISTMETGVTIIAIGGAFKFQEMTGIPLTMISFLPFR